MPSDATDSKHVLVQQRMYMMGHDAVLLTPTQHTEELPFDKVAAAAPQGFPSSAQAQSCPAACSKQQPYGQHSGLVRMQQDPVTFSTHQAIYELADPPYQDAPQNPRLKAAQVPSPKLCCTVTTGIPVTLQQLQATSRAICEAAAAGAIAAAATIPGGPIMQPQHSMHVDLSTRFPAHWLAEPDVGSHAPQDVSPVLAFSAVSAHQQSHSMGALQDTSAQFMQEVFSDDIAQQLHMKALQRKAFMHAHLGAVAAALKRQQELQESSLPAGMASPKKRRCFKGPSNHSGAFNNLSIQCGRRPSDHDNETYHPSPAACAGSPYSMDSACTPVVTVHAFRTFGHAAASPYTPTTCNNNGAQGLCPVLSQHFCPEPTIAANQAVLVQHPTPVCEALNTTTPGAVAYQGSSSGSRLHLLARRSASPSAQQQHLQSFTSGVDTLLKPSEREAAAADALADAAYAAAYAAAAMTGAHPNTTSRIAKQLAAAAVHAVKQDLTAASAGQEMVPQALPYTVFPCTADLSTPLAVPATGYLTAAFAGQEMLPQALPYTVFPNPADASTPLAVPTAGYAADPSTLVPTLGYAADPSTTLANPAYAADPSLGAWCGTPPPTPCYLADPACEITPFTQYYIEQPHPLSGCRKALFMQQEGSAQLETPMGCGAAWDSTACAGSAMAAGAGYVGSSWAAGGEYGDAHIDCGHWQLVQRGGAAKRRASTAPNAAFPQPGGLQGAQYAEQVHHAQCEEGYASPLSSYYQQPTESEFFLPA